MSVQPIIAELLALGDVKVWSVLVTLFGDQAQLRAGTPRSPAEDHIAGPDLSRIIERLSIKPEALRVALHRLRKDGWVDSAKAGRISHYRMTAPARHETLAVRDYIYARRLAPPAALWLVHGQSDVQIPGAVPLGRKLALTDTPPGPDLLAGQIHVAGIPDWIGSQLLNDSEHARFAALLTILERNEIPACDDADDRAALRLIVLHSWRRLILRQNPLAMSLLPQDAPVSMCRRSVSDWLEKLTPDALA